MTDRILSLLAFAVLAGFLVILGVNVPHPDLLAIIALTLGFAGYDLFFHDRRR